MSRVSPIYSVIYNKTDITCAPFLGTRNHIPVTTFTSFSLKKPFEYIGDPVYCDWFETHRIAVFYFANEDDEPTFLKIYVDGTTEEVEEGDPDYELLVNDCPDVVNTGATTTLLDILDAPSRSSTPDIIDIRAPTPESQPYKKQKAIVYENSLLSSI